MTDKLRRLLLASRPISWINTAYPFAAAYLVTGGQAGIVFWLASLYFLIPYNLLMYGINDIFDFESDQKNPRKGGLEGARDQKDLHRTIAWAAGLSNLPLVAFLLLHGSALANIVLIALLFFVVAYSLAGLRFKEIPLLDSFTSSVHFFGPMVYALMLTGFETSYLPYVLAFMCWGMASHAFGAVQDIVPDRHAGIGSIATAFGATPTMRLVVALYVAACVILFTQGWTAAIVGLAGLAYVVNALPYAGLSDTDSFKANRGWRRFIWLNLFVGAVLTMTLLASHAFVN